MLRVVGDISLIHACLQTDLFTGQPQFCPALGHPATEVASNVLGFVCAAHCSPELRFVPRARSDTEMGTTEEGHTHRGPACLSSGSGRSTGRPRPVCPGPRSRRG